MVKISQTFTERKKVTTDKFPSFYFIESGVRVTTAEFPVEARA